MSIDTRAIRRSLLKVTQKYTDKRMEKLSDDVMALCDEYDEIVSLSTVVKAGNKSLKQSFDMLESLRKSL